MSQFSINLYLIDENGDYILTDQGDKIIISTVSIDVDNESRRLGVDRWRRQATIQSFDVKKLDQDNWYLTVNKHHLVGQYPTQSMSISVLYGMYTSMNGNENGFSVWLEDQINKGSSTIDPDTNILTLVNNGPEAPSDSRLTVTLSNYALGNNVATFIQLEQSTDNASWNIVGTTVTVTGDAVVNFNQIRYDSINENSYYRAVLIGVDNQLNQSTLGISNNLVKDDSLDTMGLSVTISSSSTETLPVVPSGYAFANSEVTGLAPGKSASLAYDWARELPTLTRISAETQTDTTTTLAMTVDLSSDSESIEALDVGDTAYALTQVSGLESGSLSYEWNRQIPTLAGIFVETQTETTTLAMTVDLSSDSESIEKLNVGDTAYAVTEVSGLGSGSLSYDWSRRIPRLTSITSEINL